MGVKTIKLDENDENDEVVIGLPIHSDNDTVAIFSTKGYGKKLLLKNLLFRVKTEKDW